MLTIQATVCVDREYDEDQLVTIFFEYDAEYGAQIYWVQAEDGAMHYHTAVTVDVLTQCLTAIEAQREKLVDKEQDTGYYY